MAPARQKYCRKCGDPVRSADDRFCGVCGAPYDEAPPASVPPPSALAKQHVSTSAPTELDVDALRPTKKVPVAELMEQAAEAAARETNASGREPSQPVPLVRHRPSAESIPIVGKSMEALREPQEAGGRPPATADARGTTSAWDVAEISIDEPLELPGRRWGGCLLKTVLILVVLLAAGGAAAWFFAPAQSRQFLHDVGIDIGGPPPGT